MNCKYHKIRTDKGIKYGYCIYNKEKVCLFNCKCENEEFKEYKKINSNNTLRKTSKIHSKKENKRFSIFDNQNKEKCSLCQKTCKTDINEIFEGAYRSLSIKYGACNYLCRDCHNRFHDDRLLNLQLKLKFQNKLIDMYGYEWFISNFKIDYEYLLEQYKKKL